MQTNFKIHGLERRILKKEYSQLKSFVKNNSYFNQMEKDMYEFGLGSKPQYDEENQKFLNKIKKRIEEIEKILKEEND